MTIEQCLSSKKPFLELSDVIPDILPISIPTFRKQVFRDKSRLGFPVVIVGTRVLIPRVQFLHYLMNFNNETNNE